LAYASAIPKDYLSQKQRSKEKFSLGSGQSSLTGAGEKGSSKLKKRLWFDRNAAISDTLAASTRWRLLNTAKNGKKAGVEGKRKKSYMSNR